MASGDPLGLPTLLEHINDAEYFHVPRSFTSEEQHGHINIPQFYDGPGIEIQSIENPLMPGHSLIEPLDLRITKFMILEVVGAVIVLFIFIVLANKMRGSTNPKGRFRNTFEAMLLFLRDEVARPAIGKHDADKFLPFLWTLFFFVLVCNLLGMVPWLGSPTGDISRDLQESGFWVVR